jgi:MFS family permease
MTPVPESSGGLLTNRNFILLWQGQFVSQAGNQAFAVAMIYWLMQETGSATLMGLLMMISILPGIVLGPIGGAVADRHSRKHIIVFADAFRGIVVLGFAVLLLAIPQATMLTVVMLFAVVLFKSIAGAAFQPAVAAAIPDMVRPEKVAAANSMNQFSIQTAVLCGQVAGGILYRCLGAPVLFAIDGASYILSAISEAFIRIPESKPVDVASGRAALAKYGADAVEGLRHVWRHSGMRNLLITAAAVNFLAMPVIVLLPFFVSLTLQQGAEWYGFLLAAMGAGALLGYAAVGLGTIPAPRRPLIIAACFISVSLSISMLAVVSKPVYALYLFVALGLCTGVINVLVVTTFQVGSPPRLRGRILSVVYTLSSAVSPLGMAVGGILGDATGMNISAVYFGCSVLMLTTILVAISRDSFRRFLEVEVI